jgi:protein phosphatase 2C-like protein
MRTFEVTGGGVCGRAHAEAGRNNQDAFAWAEVTGGGLVAVVCDGCGGSPSSEVGAKLGARLFAGVLARELEHSNDGHAAAIEEARRSLLVQLSRLAQSMAASRESFARAVIDYFLFTLVGVAVAKGAATTFSAGDGLIIVNRERRLLGPFAENEPPYLGYALLGESRAARAQLEIGRSLPDTDLESVVLASDGIEGFEAAAGKPAEALIDDDKLFLNADMLRRRLVVAGRGAKGAAMADDTSVVVVRRLRT